MDIHLNYGRQLMNVIEDAVALSDSKSISMSNFNIENYSIDGISKYENIDDKTQFKEIKKQFVESFERKFITRALRNHKGNISHTATAIGIRRQSLQEKIQILGIDVNLFK